MDRKRASLLMGAGLISGGLVVAGAGWVLESPGVDGQMVFAARVGGFVTAAAGVVFLVVGLLRRR